MEFLLLGLISLTASLLTFFSGFGLGTLLTPAFLLFFSLQEAILMTAVVHLLNGLFKLILVYKDLSLKVLKKFAPSSALGALCGSYLFTGLYHLPPVGQYYFKGETYVISYPELAVALLMAGFAILELIPSFNRKEAGKENLIAGGFISGLFGGFSGQQGALRSAFLLHAGLDKRAFIATGVATVCLVDIIRVPVYLWNSGVGFVSNALPELSFCILCAFTGAYAGNKLLDKISLTVVRYTVCVMLMMMSFLLGTGILNH